MFLFSLLVVHIAGTPFSTCPTQFVSFSTDETSMRLRPGDLSTTFPDNFKKCPAFSVEVEDLEMNK